MSHVNFFASKSIAFLVIGSHVVGTPYEICMKQCSSGNNRERHLEVGLFSIFTHRILLISSRTPEIVIFLY